MANVIGSGIARTIVDADGDPVNVSDAGNLMVDIGAASISGDLSVNLTQTDKVSIWGNEQADGEGTARAILTDDGGRLQVDVIAAPSTAVTCDTAGNLLATVGHDITGMVSGANTDVGTSAEILRALGNVACKRVDVIASSANTGVIWVGGSNLVATSGIPLSPGDFYSVDVAGTSDIYVLAAENGEDVYFNYFT